MYLSAFGVLAVGTCMRAIWQAFPRLNQTGICNLNCMTNICYVVRKAQAWHPGTRRARRWANDDKRAATRQRHCRTTIVVVIITCSRASSRNTHPHVSPSAIKRLCLSDVTHTCHQGTQPDITRSSCAHGDKNLRLMNAIRSDPLNANKSTATNRCTAAASPKAVVHARSAATQLTLDALPLNCPYPQPMQRHIPHPLHAPCMGLQFLVPFESPAHAPLPPAPLPPYTTSPPPTVPQVYHY